MKANLEISGLLLPAAAEQIIGRKARHISS
jgi:hypothetical protein